MNNFFKEEIKELLYLPTIKSKKIYSIVIEKSIDTSNNIDLSNKIDLSNNNICNKLILFEFLTTSQNKNNLIINQYNYYKKNENNFILPKKKHDFNIEIKKDTSGNKIDIYQISEIIYNIFLREDYYNLYILKNNVIFNTYRYICKNNMNGELRTLIHNYLLLIINNKE